MELPRQLCDGADKPRRGAVHGVRDHREAALAHCLEIAPAGTLRQHGEIAGFRLRVCRGEDEHFRLQVYYLFQTDLRPILRSINYGNGPRAAQRVGNERVLADRNERIGPHDKQHPAPRKLPNPALDLCQAPAQLLRKRLSRLANSQHLGQTRRGGDYVVHRVRICGVGRNVQIIERANRLVTIEALGHEYEIRSQRRDLFEIGINRAAHFSLFLRLRRIVAIISVPYQAVLRAERIEGFREAGCERNDAAHRLGNAHVAPGFVREFHKSCGSRLWRRKRCCLSRPNVRISSCPRTLLAELRELNLSLCRNSQEKRDGHCRAGRSRALRSPAKHHDHSPWPDNKKPHENPWGHAPRSLSRRTYPPAAREGSLAYGFCSRSQWRDRGRFARPSPLPGPAKSRFERAKKLTACGVSRFLRPGRFCREARPVPTLSG